MFIKPYLFIYFVQRVVFINTTLQVIDYVLYVKAKAEGNGEKVVKIYPYSLEGLKKKVEGKCPGLKVEGGPVGIKKHAGKERRGEV